jgi:hypothetical protein
MLVVAEHAMGGPKMFMEETSMTLDAVLASNAICGCVTKKNDWL